ncbi:hypothetical protein E4A48_11830 [Xanthomonas cerealis pv. cerealis]|uniref:Uncharacterized protein n=1 Tax=Xanthomonas cerealis pv. cerealis TaxID=152263 RepID=A0A514EE29_9XANT|nr:hypothetical protein [Xanthomonas translucens]QDI04290.1 hypothetical protein E4A48_11830 [Xanthomonas translucens pv. cerealis]
MSRADDFIRGEQMPDIVYRTVAPEEEVCPRISVRGGTACVYMHNERAAPHKGFVPVAEFLQRLARSEPNLAITGYRANGKQTTLSFNRAERVTLSARLQAHLSTLNAPRQGKSASVVAFLASLTPLYTHENHEGVWSARSLQDGSLVLPVDESDWEEERGTVRMLWQGDAARETLVDGSDIATLALERYVRLHGAGATEEAIAAELWFMAEHFRFKTGCDLYLPQLKEPPGAWTKAGRKALEIGQGILTNLMSP